MLKHNLRSTTGVALGLRRDLKFLQFGDAVLAVAGRFHLLVDEKDFSFRADVERPTLGERLPIVDNSVSLRSLLSRIAKNGVVQLKRLGELCVLFRRVTTGGKVGNVELTKGVAALTERLALSRSATGERFRIPRNYDRLLAAEIRQLVGLSV